MNFKLQIKRRYETHKKTDGFRILVDRLWPRGISKEQAHIDLWLKDIAPSATLRKWFQHDPEKWPEFKKKYFKELKNKQDLIDQILKVMKEKPVTLLFAATNIQYNNAAALKNYIEVI